jgi:hypothetical protein
MAPEPPLPWPCELLKDQLVVSTFDKTSMSNIDADKKEKRFLGVHVAALWIVTLMMMKVLPSATPAFLTCMDTCLKEMYYQVQQWCAHVVTLGSLARGTQMEDRVPCTDPQGRCSAHGVGQGHSRHPSRDPHRAAVRCESLLLQECMQKSEFAEPLCLHTLLWTVFVSIVPRNIIV